MNKPDDIEALLVEYLLFHEKPERVLNMNQVVGVGHGQVD